MSVDRKKIIDSIARAKKNLEIHKANKNEKAVAKIEQLIKELEAAVSVKSKAKQETKEKASKGKNYKNKMLKTEE